MLVEWDELKERVVVLDVDVDGQATAASTYDKEAAVRGVLLAVGGGVGGVVVEVEVAVVGAAVIQAASSTCGAEPPIIVVRDISAIILKGE